MNPIKIGEDVVMLNNSPLKAVKLEKTMRGEITLTFVFGDGSDQEFTSPKYPEAELLRVWNTVGK